MNKLEFIEFLLEKKSVDTEVISASKTVVDFPLAYKIINSVSGSDFLKTLLNPKRYGEIDLAFGDIKRNVDFSKLGIKQEAIRFLEDLVIQSKLKFELSNNKYAN